MMSVMTHKLVEHVGEVELELGADDEKGIFEAALDAFADLVATDGRGEPARHVIELESDDHALLLVDWLTELVYLAEVEQFVPEQAARLSLAGRHLTAAVEGRRAAPRHLVKAVTLNDLALGERDGRWHARVVLDV